MSAPVLRIIVLHVQTPVYLASAFVAVRKHRVCRYPRQGFIAVFFILCKMWHASVPFQAKGTGWPDYPPPSSRFTVAVSGFFFATTSRMSTDHALVPTIGRRRAPQNNLSGPPSPVPRTSTPTCASKRKIPLQITIRPLRPPLPFINNTLRC